MKRKKFSWNSTSAAIECVWLRLPKNAAISGKNTKTFNLLFRAWCLAEMEITNKGNERNKDNKGRRMLGNILGIY